jgi:phosphohistidine phosphatase
VARRLLLLRHAKTEEFRPGGRDVDRRLTGRGEGQAHDVGAYLIARGVRCDAVLCSSSVRTRQTWELASLEAPAGGVDFSERYYDGGTDELLEAVRALDDRIQTALLVGHAPGVPGLAYELADPDASDPTAVAAIATRFPPATLAWLEFEGPWSDVQTAILVEARLPTA